MQQLITFDNDKIIVNHDSAWFQENISKLTNILLAQLDNCIIKEKYIGADRESLRFSWQNDFYYILHFDCYSQSCWLEADDDASKSEMNNLFIALNK